MEIQWYPGHMAKTRRMITEQLRNVDAVCEILDARIPLSSRNPDVEELTAGKPRLMVLNRVDLADPAATKAWGAWFRGRGFAVLECNAKQGQGTRQFPAAVRSLLADKLAAYAGLNPKVKQSGDKNPVPSICPNAVRHICAGLSGWLVPLRHSTIPCSRPITKRNRRRDCAT